jgi:tetratricopeptide (TPR) repeat protein
MPDEKYEQALGRFTAAATPTSPLRAHAAYYAGVSELRLNRFDAARRRFSELKKTPGFVGEAAALGEAEAAHAKGDFGDAAKIYEDILDKAAVDIPAIWLSLANDGACGRRSKRAAAAYLHLYYEFPLSEHADQAEGPLQTCRSAADRGRQRALQAGNGRGERLFGSRRYADARTSFLRLKPHAKATSSRAGVVAACRDRLFPGAIQQRARSASDRSSRAAPGRLNALLLPDVAARAGATTTSSSSWSCARAGFSRQHVAEEGAEQPRDL